MCVDQAAIYYSQHQRHHHHHPHHHHQQQQQPGSEAASSSKLSWKKEIRAAKCFGVLLAVFVGVAKKYRGRKRRLRNETYFVSSATSKPFRNSRWPCSPCAGYRCTS